MTLQWIPLEALQAHPENSNRMPDRLVEKLKAHLARTGRYEPLVVRPLPDNDKRGGSPHPPRAPRQERGGCGEPPRSDPGTGAQAAGGTGARYQILNGHHRARALRDLGHTHARCDVWDVDDDEARLLLATLNRLEGRDDPSRRAALVARLGDGRSAEDLARLLPEPPDAVERLRSLASPPPPPPADPEAAAPLPRPMTFFLDEDAAATVREALRAAGNSPRGGSPPRTSPAGSTRRGARRADALVRLAEWYLEAQGQR
jgi:hypothetical protein